MFEKADNLNSILGNPLAIANAALKEIENRLDGKCVIADPNSPACHLLEFGSSIVANAIRSIEDRMPQIYPARAETMEDLAHHMSDYDYLHMSSSPSSVKVLLSFAKKYLQENALSFTDSLKKVTIPKSTRFTIGRYTFGLYYPVDIIINEYTKSFTTVYDTSKQNPLMSLTSNIVPNYNFHYAGLDYITLELTLYQFSKSIITETLNVGTGFAKKYTYNNKFYACRIFSVSNDKWTELSQTQSTLVYDTQIPTAWVQVLPDSKELKIVIPQVYLTERSVGSKLIIELYTTLGKLDVNAGNLSSVPIQVKYGDVGDRDITKYSAIFRNYPFDTIIRLNGNISGGKDALDFATIRDRVVNNRLYDTVPITEAEIADYLNDRDFTVVKYIDNVTDRSYRAYHALSDTSGKVIASRNTKLAIAANYPDRFESCIKQSDDSFTILPTTWYRYSQAADCAIPITMAEAKSIIDGGKANIVKELNANQYLKTPFHLRVDTADYYPRVVSFNLMSPFISEMKFLLENYDLTYKMRAFDAELRHLENGVGGYELILSVQKTEDVKSVAEEDLLVYMITNTRGGYTIGGEATFIAATEDRAFYRLPLKTNYRITEDGEIAITNLKYDNSSLTEHMIKMTNVFEIIFLIKRKAIVGSYSDAAAEVVSGVPDTYLTDYVGMARQSVKLHFGYSLNNVIRNDIEITSTARQYEVWESDVPLTYTEDVYQRNEDGSLYYEVGEDDQISLVKLHSIGDQMLDDSGVPIFRHRAGDVKYDTLGSPIIKADRTKQYYADCMFIDAKLFASERTSETDFVTGLYDTLKGYLTTVETLQDQLLERTHVYFYCSRSTGLATFNIGDGVKLTENVEMSFKINCYVPSYVKKDEAIQDIIKTRTCEAIEDAIKNREISMLDIFKTVKEKMAGYVDHFDLLGVNGDPTLQTFTIEDMDTRPSIRRKLILTEDNTIELINDIDITFIALVDNTANTVSAEV